jgi:predicted  nucleic acid-binding Zn-ribbon protein
MNTIYRSIYNEALGAWTAVAEFAKARGKRSGGSQTASAVETKVSKPKLLAAALVAAGLSVAAPSVMAKDYVRAGWLTNILYLNEGTAGDINDALTGGAEAATGIADLNGRVDTVNGRVDTVNGRVDAVNTRVDAVVDDVTDLKGRTTALEGRAGALEDRAGALEDRAGALEGRAGALEGRAGALEDRAGALEDRAGALEDRAGALEGRAGALEDRAGALEGRTGALEELVGSGTFGLKDNSGKKAIQSLGEEIRVSGDKNITAQIETQRTWVSGPIWNPTIEEEDYLEVSLNNQITLGERFIPFVQSGEDGKITVLGADRPAKVVIDGADGTISFAGLNNHFLAPAPGVNNLGAGFVQGTLEDDSDWTSRLVYTPVVLNGWGNKIGEGEQQQLAVLNDGLRFAANSGDTQKVKLNQTLNIVGGEVGEADLANYSTTNVTTVAQNVDGQQQIQILMSDKPTFEEVTITDALIVGNGATIDMGDNQVTNVADGTEAHHAVNKGQLDALTITFVDEDGDTGTFKLTENIPLTSKDGNLVIKASDDSLDFGLAKVVTIGDPSQHSGKDNNPVTIDGEAGSITLVKKFDHREKLNAEFTLDKGDPVLGSDEDFAPRLVYTAKYREPGKESEWGEEVTFQLATTDDGLIFAGDEGAMEAPLSSVVNINGSRNIKTAVKTGTELVWDDEVGEEVEQEFGYLEVALKNKVTLG